MTAKEEEQTRSIALARVARMARAVTHPTRHGSRSHGRLIECPTLSQVPPPPRESWRPDIQALDCLCSRRRLRN